MRWSAVLIGFAGVMMVVGPGSDTFSLGALAALLAGCLETKGACTVAVLSGGNADPGLFSEIVSAD